MCVCVYMFVCVRVYVCVCACTIVNKPLVKLYHKIPPLKD